MPTKTNLDVTCHVSYPMIRHTVLGEIVGTDSLRLRTGSYLSGGTQMRVTSGRQTYLT